MERLFGHIFLHVPHNPPQALFEVAARQLHSARFEKRLLQTEHMMHPTLRQPRCGLRKSSRTSRSTPEVFRNMASRDCPQVGFGRPVAVEWPACGMIFGGMSFPLLTRWPSAMLTLRLRRTAGNKIDVTNFTSRTTRRPFCLPPLSHVTPRH